MMMRGNASLVVVMDVGADIDVMFVCLSGLSSPCVFHALLNIAVDGIELRIICGFITSTLEASNDGAVLVDVFSTRGEVLFLFHSENMPPRINKSAMKATAVCPSLNR